MSISEFNFQLYCLFIFKTGLYSLVVWRCFSLILLQYSSFIEFSVCDNFACPLHPFNALLRESRIIIPSFTLSKISFFTRWRKTPNVSYYQILHQKELKIYFEYFFLAFPSYQLFVLNVFFRSTYYNFGVQLFHQNKQGKLEISRIFYSIQ